MCGIAGVVGREGACQHVTRMIAALAHRGPDGAGVFSAGRDVAVGHARLAILDLSPAGAQPMTSRDGRWTLAFNGEIFNYQELREELGRTPWRSSSDTEVLLEACAAWGIGRALDRSIGMFAFALWDARAQELTLARDRIGEKPLVYFEDGHTLAFASEVKALREFHGGRLDRPALDVSGAGLRPGSPGDFPQRPETSGWAPAALERRREHGRALVVPGAGSTGSFHHEDRKKRGGARLD